MTVRDMMTAALQDERTVARFYQQILGRFGDARPFNRLQPAELRHASAIEFLFQKREWPMPDMPVEAAPDMPDKYADAVNLAYRQEVENVAMYDAFLDQDLPADVREVFLNLRAASAQRHMRALARHGGAMPATLAAQPANAPVASAEPCRSQRCDRGTGRQARQGRGQGQRLGAAGRGLGNGRGAGRGPGHGCGGCSKTR